MSVKKPDAPTNWEAVTERARKALADPARSADIEQQWAAWNEKKRKEEAGDLKRAQREVLRGMDLPIDALELLERGEESNTPAMAAALSSPADIVVLSGGVGTGKTLAAVAWLRAWVMDRRHWNIGDAGPVAVGRCAFTTAPALQRGPRFDAKWVQALMRAARLVVDDLGAEYVDEKRVFTALVEEVVNERYARRRPTLITTNLDIATFRARYGQRVADRIRERGQFENVGTKSMRGGGKR